MILEIKGFDIGLQFGSLKVDNVFMPLPLYGFYASTTLWETLCFRIVRPSI